MREIKCFRDFFTNFKFSPQTRQTEQLALNKTKNAPNAVRAAASRKYYD